MLRKLAAEGLGTALLLIGVVGSGIMGETLAQGNTGIALLANAIATGCILYVIITIFGPISGAHFNPVVTAYFWNHHELPSKTALLYILVQISGGILGVWLTHAMFDLPVWQISTTDRTGASLWMSEVIATFGLLLIIVGGLRARAEALPTLVALYITGAYWFTSSTSFANPAVTIARGLSDTFAGINPTHVPHFISMQFIGLLIALFALPWIFARSEN